MDKQELLHKWMNGELSPQQEEQLRTDGQIDRFLDIAEAASRLEPPHFDKEAVLKDIKVLNQPPKVRRLNPLKYVVRIAAVFAIVALGYIYWQGLDTEVSTEIAEKTQIFLPDESEVQLNADSYLTFNSQKWGDARKLLLKGEAYFKVAKGSAFTVETDQGDITVLGTEFNVFARHGQLKVSCFEGVVSVSLNDEVITLRAGDAIEAKAGQLTRNLQTKLSTPRWLQDESSFENAPLSEVLEDLEHYYEVNLQFENVDLSKRFTGSFTHKDLDIALKSICNPLQMTYRVLDKNNVVLNEAK